MQSLVEQRFPHLTPKLVASWGDRLAFEAFMSELMFDRRGGRRGLPEEVWLELRFLQQVHQLLMRERFGHNMNEPLPDELKWV